MKRFALAGLTAAALLGGGQLPAAHAACPPVCVEINCQGDACVCVDEEVAGQHVRKCTL